MLVGAVVFPFLVLAAPLSWTFLIALLFSAVLVGLFLATDLLTVLLAGFVTHTLFVAYPLLTAGDAGLQIQGWIALGLLAAPLLASVRYLGGGKEFVYRYEDIPPHVRRIAERERQRVELETARRIQSSILPDLPPRLAGVDIAHAYLPASEVGGDFYDVLALEDGRLAVAVGDVAGHGVSSGLIMSMAKSALAVQVTFDPEVAAVFNTLNRTVYQTARKRLLTTLCYAVLDPRRLELLYASAGHLHPYRIARDRPGRCPGIDRLSARGARRAPRHPANGPDEPGGYPLPVQRRHHRGAAGGERRDVRLRSPGREPRPPRRPRGGGAARRRSRRRGPLHQQRAARGRPDDPGAAAAVEGIWKVSRDALPPGMNARATPETKSRLKPAQKTPSFFEPASAGFSFEA